MAMSVGLTVVEIHLSEARSLKEKRMVLTRVKTKLRNRFNVSVSEVEYQDLWQRAAIAVVSVADSREIVEKLLHAVEDEVDRELPGEVVRAKTEFLV